MFWITFPRNMTAQASRALRPKTFKFYYKLPAVLNFGGRRELAQRTLDQTLRRFVHDGVFRLGDDPAARQWIAYLACWLAWEPVRWAVLI